MSGDGIGRRDWIKALTTSLVVGTILLLINQFDALFGDSDFRLVPGLLTYVVPFCVFWYGRLSNVRAG